MNDQSFLEIIKDSFLQYLHSGARSNKKLHILHSKIATDLNEKLGSLYKINSLGFGDLKEKNILGRYYDKKIDIAISKNNQILAGVGVKFVMSNYSQNSNNYFENMLGETANIRSNHIAYFQIFIIFEELPYFGTKNGVKIVKKIEKIRQNNIIKYIKLSDDNIDLFFHTPNKTLIYIVKNSIDFKLPLNEIEYKKLFLNENFEIRKSKLKFDFKNSVIYNDYTEFLYKISHFIQSI